MRVMKKIAPAVPKKGKNTGACGGETHQALPAEEIKQRPRKPTKSADAPSIRHDIKYTQSPGRNQPMKGNSHNQHTHRRHPKQAAAAADPRTIRARQANDNDADLPAPRHEQAGRASETSGTER